MFTDDLLVVIFDGSGGNNASLAAAIHLQGIDIIGRFAVLLQDAAAEFPPVLGGLLIDGLVIG